MMLNQKILRHLELSNESPNERFLSSGFKWVRPINDAKLENPKASKLSNESPNE